MVTWLLFERMDGRTNCARYATGKACRIEVALHAKYEVRRSLIVAPNLTATDSPDTLSL